MEVDERIDYVVHRSTSIVPNEEKEYEDGEPSKKEYEDGEPSKKERCFERCFDSFSITLFEQNDLSIINEEEIIPVKDFSDLNDILFTIRDSNAKQKNRTDFFSVIRKCILCKIFIPCYYFYVNKIFLEKRFLGQSSDFSLTINPSNVTDINLHSI